MRRLITFILLLVSVACYPQDTCFTQSEIIGIFTNVRKLEQTDSLKSVLIVELEREIQLNESLHAHDSLSIMFRDQEINLLNRSVNLHKQLIQIVEPKWYDSKYIWFLLGSGTFIATSYVTLNIR
jgi:hypothetical protein